MTGSTCVRQARFFHFQRIRPGRILFLAFLTLISKAVLLQAQLMDISIDSTQQKISAYLENAPLDRVIEKIKQEKRIWIKGQGYLEGRKISVEFKALPFEKGLKRLLSTVNHAIVFNPDGSVSGVIIVKTEDSKWTRSPASARQPRRRLPHSYRRR